MLFSKQLERFKKNKKRRSSPHVEIESTCGDDRQFLIRSPSAAGDRHQNGEHRGGRLSSCQKKSLVLFTVCLFFLFFRELRKIWPPARKKNWRKTLGRTPYCPPLPKDAHPPPKTGGGSPVVRPRPRRATSIGGASPPRSSRCYVLFL